MCGKWKEAENEGEFVFFERIERIDKIEGIDSIESLDSSDSFDHPARRRGPRRQPQRPVGGERARHGCAQPYVRYQSDGSLLVVWYRDGKIMSAKGLALADQTVAGEVGIGSSAQDFKLMAGPAGQLSVVWQDAGTPGVASPDPHILNFDPALGAYGIALSTNSVVFGESVEVGVTVENRGELPVTNLAVCVYENGVLLGATQRVAQVLGGTSEVVTVAWTIPKAVSNVVLYAAVDPGLETADRNRANNVASLAALMPDLSVAGASAINETTNMRLVSASVLDEGAVPVAEGTRTDLTDSDGDGLSDTAEVRTHGTNPLLRDSDGDGADDGKELAAGTDPNSATDIFKIVAADGSEAYVMSVTWNAKAGGVYQVEAAASLAGP